MYADHATIHRALGLAGAPVPQGGTEAASGEAFRQYVFSQLVSGVPDRVLHCVEDAQRTFGPTTEYFPNLFQKLTGRANSQGEAALPAPERLGSSSTRTPGYPDRSTGSHSGAAAGYDTTRAVQISVDIQLTYCVSLFVFFFLSLCVAEVLLVCYSIHLTLFFCVLLCV